MKPKLNKFDIGRRQANLPYKLEKKVAYEGLTVIGHLIGAFPK